MKLALLPNPEGKGADWLGDLSQLPRATKQWQRFGPSHGPTYRCSDYPGVEIKHCGHPTAHRPYYFAGIDTIRKVRLLEDAKACVEAIHNGLIEARNLCGR